MAQCIVLVISSGSPSIEYQLVDSDSGTSLASDLVERIDEETGAATHKHGEERTEITELVLDHGFSSSGVLRLLEGQDPSLADVHIMAVGHRVVQDGRYFSGPALINDDVVARAEQLVPLGPLHSPARLKDIEVGRRLLPNASHVAVFDTIFFQDLSGETVRYAPDREIADICSIYRYGAYGISHQFVSGAAPELLGRDNLKQVVLRLGNGVSASAVVAGHAMGTSTGLTSLEDLAMGGHTDDIGPAVVFHLARVASMSIDEIDHLFNRGLSMRGLAGGNDIREMWKRTGAGK